MRRTKLLELAQAAGMHIQNDGCRHIISAKGRNPVGVVVYVDGSAQRAHGDYASEHRPSVADVLTEAAMFMSHGLNPSPEQIEEAGEHYKCPCGDCAESA
ncbi:MAG: hypothetical protein BGO63_03710 [Candidatus Accumulibacter sp. 66-26]|nr:MAG: hypothetical protein BGO63_03710 [Candidatus Accumulibacter sp. 66-26]